MRNHRSSNTILRVRKDGSGDFRAIQPAIDHLWRNYDLAGYGAEVQVGVGKYNENVIMRTPLGADTASDGRDGMGCILKGEPGAVIDGQLYAIGSGTQWFVTDFSFTDPGGISYFVYGHAEGWVRLGNVSFGTMTSGHAHVAADFGGTVEFMRSYNVTGGAPLAHAIAQQHGQVLQFGPLVTVSNTPRFDRFIYCDVNSNVNWGGAISGQATGKRFFVDNNSTIATNGRDIDFFPGDQPGFVGSSGRYI